MPGREGDGQKRGIAGKDRGKRKQPRGCPSAVAANPCASVFEAKVFSSPVVTVLEILGESHARVSDATPCVAAGCGESQPLTPSAALDALTGLPLPGGQELDRGPAD